MRDGILLHILEGRAEASKLWVGHKEELEALPVGEEVLQGLRQFWQSTNQVFFWGSSVARDQGPVVVIAERMVERHSLLVFGAGHVGYSIAAMGVLIGFNVLLIDDRMEFLDRVMLTESRIDCRLADFDRISGSIEIEVGAAVVIVTRGHQCDESILRQVADFDPGYVGMIGSRRRVEGVFRRLREQGVSDTFLKAVKAPIGLDIGAKTPQEIAVSVHAEIIKHFNGANS